MVDITIVFVGIIMVYKPTNITGGGLIPRISELFNGNFRILKWSYVSTIKRPYFVGIF